VAGRTPKQAVKTFLEPIRLVLSCVTGVQLSRTQDTSDTDRVLVLADGHPVPLACTQGTSLAMRVTQNYRVVRAEGQRGPWKVKITAYYYTLEDDHGAEILSFQWHPKGRSPVVYPHLHLGAAAAVGHQHLAEAYVPTGRVPLEQFLWLLIDGFHVQHGRPDWKDVLVRTRKKFEQWRTWE